MSRELKDVQWSYGGKAEGFRESGVIGALVSVEAIPEGRPVPAGLTRAATWTNETSLEEHDETIEGPIEMEALCFSGRVQWWKGEEWWEFSTLSSYSVTLWAGILDGHWTTTEELA